MAEKALDIILGAKGADAVGHALDHVGQHLEHVGTAARHGKEHASTALAELREHIRETTASAFGLKEAMKLGGVVGLVIGAAEQVKKTVEAAIEGDEALTKMAAALRLAGDGSKVAVHRMKEFAVEIERTTKLSREEVMEAASLGASLGGMVGEPLREATRAAVGLSEKLQIDLHTAMQLVSRAAQGNFAIFGRYGIQIDKNATAQQNYNTILHAGIDAFWMAEARTNALSGAWANFEHRIAGVREAIGEGLTKALPSVLDVVGNTLESFEHKAEEVAHAIEPVWQTMSHVITAAWREATKEFDAVRGIVGNVVGSVRAHFDDMYGIVSVFGVKLTPIFTGIAHVAVAAFDAVKGALSSTSRAIPGVLPTWETLKFATITSLTATEYAFAHLRDIVELTALRILYSNVKIEGQIRYVFTDVIPGLLDWLRTHWMEVFIDILNFNERFTANLGKNISNFTAAVRDAVEGKGFNFKWTGLTDGFHTAISELPKIAERHASELEKALYGAIDAKQKLMGLQFSDMLKENLKAVDAVADAHKQMQAHIAETARDAGKEIDKAASATKKAIGDGSVHVTLDLKSSLAEAHQMFTGATSKINEHADTMRQQLVNEAKRGNDIAAGIKTNTNAMADHAREQRQAVAVSQGPPGSDAEIVRRLDLMLDEWKTFRDDRDKLQNSADQLVTNTDPVAGDDLT